MLTHPRAVCKGTAHMDNFTTHCIYRIVNFRNGKVYIGQTQNSEDRYDQHFTTLKNNNHHSRKLQSAFNKHGDAAFFFEVIERNIPRSQIDEREVYWIARYDSFRSGYNMTPGGLGGGNYKSVMIGQVEYESIYAACEATGFTIAEMRTALKRRKHNKIS